MFMLFMLNLITTLTFLMLTHPLSMGLILLFQTILISLITGNFSMNFWFSYILFLILIGGMLILFIYMTSIASNEKFNFESSILVNFIIMLMLILLMQFIYYYLNINLMNENMTLMNSNLNMNLSLNKFMFSPLNLIFMLIISYLFITLIATVKITNFKKGSLRLKN